VFVACSGFLLLYFHTALSGCDYASHVTSKLIQIVHLDFSFNFVFSCLKTTLQICKSFCKGR